MNFKQTITENDYKIAYEFHYKTYKWTKFRPLYGALFILIGSILIVMNFELAYAIFCILFGIYMFFAKKLYVARPLRYSKQNKSFGETIEINLDKEKKMRVISTNEMSEIDLNKILYFYVTYFGILLYRQRNLFFILKKDAMDKEVGIDNVIEFLKGAGIEQKKL